MMWRCGLAWRYRCARRFRLIASLHDAVAAMAVASVLSVVCWGAALAQQPEITSPPVEVRGRAQSPLGLTTPTLTGSRLGINARAIAASVESIPEEVLRERGARNSADAIEAATGVLIGPQPGAPDTLSMRGFSGDQITTLYDGFRLGPVTMTGRSVNAWNLSRIEVLRGPGSALFGEGAVGGAVNYVTRRPDPSQPFVIEGQLGYGSFNTVNIGVGTGGRVDRWSYRFDVSRVASDGYIRRASSEATNFTSGVRFDATDRLALQVTYDYLQDQLPLYWGTPLIPPSVGTQPIAGVVSAENGWVIDSRQRRLNYNVENPTGKSTQHRIGFSIDWRVSEQFSLRNEFMHYQASRSWMNAEVYTPDAVDPTQITRDRFSVFHNQRAFVNRTYGIVEHPILAGNRLLAGLELYRLDFDRRRGNDPAGDSVDVFNPQPGTFGTLNETRLSPTRILTQALFAENLLSLTPAFKLSAALRQEWMNLDRCNFGFDGAFNETTSFRRDFRGTTWRAGALWDITPSLTGYIAYTNARDPAGSSFFLVNASQNVDLARARQTEIGLKNLFAWRPHWKGEATLSAYHIKRDRFLTQVGPEVVAQASQTSRGFEAAVGLTGGNGWRISGNVAYVLAKYDDFVSPDTGDDATGKRPPNVPRWRANLFVVNKPFAQWPLEMGAGARYVGERDGSFDNTLKLSRYTLFDVFAAWDFGNNARLTARIRNLFDKDYAQFVDTFYRNQIFLGNPRSFELALSARF